jgi:hypothetical protein
MSQVVTNECDFGATAGDLAARRQKGPPATGAAISNSDSIQPRCFQMAKSYCLIGPKRGPIGTLNSTGLDIRRDGESGIGAGTGLTNLRKMCGRSTWLKFLITVSIGEEVHEGLELVLRLKLLLDALKTPFVVTADDAPRVFTKCALFNPPSPDLKALCLRVHHFLLWGIFHYFKELATKTLKDIATLWTSRTDVTEIAELAFCEAALCLAVLGECQNLAVLKTRTGNWTHNGNGAMPCSPDGRTASLVTLSVFVFCNFPQKGNR